MEQYTVEEFQSDFDNLIARVENGESFQINYEGKSVMIIPAEEYQEAVQTISEATSEDWDDFWYNEDTLCDI
jgi:antitoxin (DNA-binding transcriptional repressor) of toxin-antitoxin stability system